MTYLLNDVLSSLVSSLSLHIWICGMVNLFKKPKPTKRENNDIYIPMNSMYKIKE
jgi:hypothetical protein